MVKGNRFPGKYLQGVGALSLLPNEIKAFADRTVVIVDSALYDTLEARLHALCVDIAISIRRHSGECSVQEIEALTRDARSFNAGLIVGIGGGKTLDTAKASGDDLGIPAIVVPTIAASDAPCSALSVIYHADGNVSHDRFLKSNPALVLVDTQIIAEAPARFLVAGIGDALATFYEAESCRLSGAKNWLGVSGGTLIAYNTAKLCLDIVLQHGVAAVAECSKKHAGEALEAVVEANILLSGIGFESGGVAAAHAIHHGLCELEDVHGYLHGEKVAIGVLASLKMHKNEAEFKKIREFCLQVGLPTQLGDIGIKEITDEKLERIAVRACQVGEIIHNEPFNVTVSDVVSALKSLQHF